MVLAMDQRSEPRYPVVGPAKVTVLGNNPTEIHGSIVNLSGKGMRILLEAAVPAGSAVRIDVDGTVLLGEICYCQPEGFCYAAGFELEQAFTLSEELAALMRGISAACEQPNWTRPA